MSDAVEIEVSAPCYYEIRRQLVRQGGAGDVVERSEGVRIEMTGITLRLDEKRVPLSADGIRTRLDVIRDAIVRESLTEPKPDSRGAISPKALAAANVANAESIAVLNAVVDLSEMLLKAFRDLGAAARERSVRLDAGAQAPAGPSRPDSGETGCD